MSWVVPFFYDESMPSSIRVVILNLALAIASQAAWNSTPNQAYDGGSIVCMLAEDSTLFVGAQNGAFRTLDDGQTWEKARFSKPVLKISSLLRMGNQLFLTDGSTVFQGSDTDSAFSPLTSDLFSGIENLFHYKGVLFATTSNGILRYNDSGSKWDRIGLEPIFKHATCLMGVGPYLFSGSYGGGVNRADSLGNQFLKDGIGLRGKDILALTSIGTSIFAGERNSGVYRSDDSGTTWSQASEGLTDLRIHALISKDHQLFASTESGGVFHSSNQGATWDSIETISSSKAIVALAIVRNQLFAGGYTTTVYRHPLESPTPSIGRKPFIGSAKERQRLKYRKTADTFTLLGRQRIRENVRRP
jgi:ligand-binding sensor domain-containing protein